MSNRRNTENKISFKAIVYKKKSASVTFNSGKTILIPFYMFEKIEDNSIFFANKKDMYSIYKMM